jgi:DNA invertase Pin-like site-specific DNA recombinase
MRTKAFSYLRVSGKGQVDGDGFPRQKEAVEKYAKANRLEIAQEFRDEGISGTKEVFDRPGLTDLFVALRANGVRLVICETSSRLARDLMVGEVILAEFRKLGTKVIAADSGVDLTAGNNDPTSVLIRQILGAVSEFEKSILVQKLRASRLRIRRAGGRCEGKKPYGHTAEEARIVESILSYRKDGKSYVAISEQLNADGIKSRSGKRWHPTQVQRVIQRAEVK